MRTSRTNATSSVTLTNDITTTPAIDLNDYAGGMLLIDASETITFYASDRKDGSYLPVYRHFPNEGTPVTFAVGNGAYPLPIEVFGAAWMKIVTTSGNLDVLITKKA